MKIERDEIIQDLTIDVIKAMAKAIDNIILGNDKGTFTTIESVCIESALSEQDAIMIAYEIGPLKFKKHKELIKVLANRGIEVKLIRDIILEL